MQLSEFLDALALDTEETEVVLVQVNDKHFGIDSVDLFEDENLVVIHLEKEPYER